MKQPPTKDTERCLTLRCQSKRGVRLHPEDKVFVERMYSEYPEWYEATEKTVFVRTAPFGANIIEKHSEAK